MLEQMVDFFAGELRELLKDPDGWKSLYVDYHKPYVERLYRDLDDGRRVSIHRIHGCETEEALLHPHPWPASFMVWGSYRMALGYSESNTPPEVVSNFIMLNTVYEMLDKNMWHSVAPAPNTTCITLMVSGKPWGRETPIKPESPLRELTQEERDSLFEEFYECIEV